MGMIGNLALLSWPLVILFLFRKLSLQNAIIWSILGGYLLLPTTLGWDLPLIPKLDKYTIPALFAAISSIVVLHQREKEGARIRGFDPTRQSKNSYYLPGWLPRSKIGLGLLTLLCFGTAMTVFTNTDPLTYGPRTLPAQRPYDAISFLAFMGFNLIPLLLARKFLANDAGHRALLIAFCLAGVVYTLPALYEVRMSPQLNVMIYGFFPHSWLQHIRGGGFRPIVFLGHGLLLGIFLACAIIAAAICARLDQRRRFLFVLAVLWLLGTLFLAKSLAALIFAIVIVPIALLMPVRLQLFAAASIAALTLFYPILRGAGMIPTEAIVETFQGLDEARAGSLAFRFMHEDMILDKASERPAFGWGGWARWRVYDEQTGIDLSVSDGAWVIAIGEAGWVGYIATFGLLTLPMILFTIRRRRYDIGLPTSGLCLVLAVNMIDLLPNDSITPLTWMLAGAILGRIEAVSENADEPGPEALAAQNNATRSRMGRHQTGEPDANAAFASASPHTRFPANKRRDPVL